MNAQVLMEGLGLDSVRVVGMNQAEVEALFGRDYSSQVDVERVCYDCPKPGYRSRHKTDPRVMDFEALGMGLHLESGRVVSAFFTTPSIVTSSGVAIGATREKVALTYGSRYATPEMRYPDRGVAFYIENDTVWGIQIFEIRQ